MLVKTILSNIFSLNNQQKVEFDFSLIEFKDMIEKQISFIETKVDVGNKVLNRMEEQLKTTYSVNKEDIDYLKDNQEYLRDNMDFNQKFLYNFIFRENDEQYKKQFNLYQLKRNLELLNDKRTNFKNNTIVYCSSYKAFFNLIKFTILLFTITPANLGLGFLLSIMILGYLIRMLHINESFEYRHIDDIKSMENLYDNLKNNNHIIKSLENNFLSSDILFEASYKEAIV